MFPLTSCPALCHYGFMFRKGLMVFAWFPLTGLLLINSLRLLSQNNLSSHGIDASEYSIRTSPLSDAGDAKPNFTGTGQVLAADIVAGDGRSELLKKFMSGSPMEPFADEIVKEADKYNMDYRLIPSIAMCESNLGVHMPSHDSYNAWGIAVYTGQQQGAKFANWTMAIQWVTKFFAEKFIQKNIVDIKDIGAVWAPPSVEKQHSWANCVEKFMRVIQ